MLRHIAPAATILACMYVSSCSLIEVKTGPSTSAAEVPTSQSYRGTANLVFAWGERLTPPRNLSRSLTNLKEAMTKYTNITTTVDQNTRLSSSKLFDASFVLMATNTSFELTASERENLRNYLMGGGFILMDNTNPTMEQSQATASFENMIRQTLGSQARLAPIPSDHDLYKIYFLFDSPPQGAEVGTYAVNSDISNGARIHSPSVNYLEGVWIDGRLAGILSNKGYILKWNEYGSNDPQMKIGVNMILYALLNGAPGQIDTE